MAFPVTLTFTDPLKIIITSENEDLIIFYIRNYINDRNADNILIENRTVSYKNSKNGSGRSLFGSVDNGDFTLVYKNNKWYLSYQINMRRLFIATGITGVAFGIFAEFMIDHRWWLGILGFMWLCGGNWLVIWIRHGALATELTELINTQFMVKHQVNQDTITQ